jgi:hypothetical protein
MSEKQRTFEVELLLAKAPKLAQEPKMDEMVVKPVSAFRKRKPRTFTRETVIRLINWFKQD